MVRSGKRWLSVTNERPSKVKGTFYFEICLSASVCEDGIRRSLSPVQLVLAAFLGHYV